MPDPCEQPVQQENKARRRPWRQRASVRIPVKLLVFVLVYFFVMYPNPRLFFTQLSRIRNLDALVEPDATQLDDWAAELQVRLDRAQAAATQPAAPSTATASSRTPPNSSNGHSASRGAVESTAASGPSGVLQRPAGLGPRAVIQQQVERFVYEKVLYAWDWDTWGCADYIPTIEEMFTKLPRAGGGRLFEDCDGRAVVAASLMRRLGFDAQLVTDLRHVWVVTPDGEWMGPGRGKAAVATPQGTQVRWSTVATNAPMSLSYGIAVFPFGRELIVLATAFVLLLHRRTPRRPAVLAAVLLLDGLLFLRCGALSPMPIGPLGASWPAFVGLLNAATGFVILFTASRRARRRAERESPSP